MATIEKLDSLSDESSELIDRFIHIWANEVLFTWRWWLGVLLSVFAWIFWIKFHKKKCRYRLLTAGLFVMLISVTLDSIGVQLGFWSYRYEVIPFVPAYLPFNLALMPVVVMSLIQYKPQLSAFKKSILFGLVTAFVGEPLVVLTDIYKLKSWEYYYSIPLYIIIYLIADWLTTRRDYTEIT